MATSASASTASFLAESLHQVTGLTVVITGGGTGLGLYAAQALAANGAKVYILGRRQDVLEQAVKEHSKGIKGSLHAVTADTTSKASLAQAAQTIAQAEGERGVDILICNAGIGGRLMSNYGKGSFDISNFDAMVKEMDSFTEEESMDIFRVNVLGTYFTATAFLPLLKKASEHHKQEASKNPDGRIDYVPQVILVSSNASVVKLPIINALYNLSKTAVTHFGQMLSTMLTESGIRTNTIEPGLYPSELTSAEPRDPTTGHSRLEGTNGAAIPAGRAGYPQEHAAAVLYLSSRSSLFANGAMLRVDGGAVQAVPSA